MLHICNTSGVLNYPEAHFDMVRTGIGLYGFGNSKKENVHFKPISTLKTVISQINSIEKGKSVGYNRAYKSNGFMKTATLPIGHADGIGRQYGNGKGFVNILGKPAPIIGNVCMDMIMVNITDINCNEGDEVLVYKNQSHIEALATAVNDGLMSQESFIKLTSVETGAQVNDIEVIKVNNVSQPIVSKVVDLSIPVSTIDILKELGMWKVHE